MAHCTVDPACPCPCVLQFYVDDLSVSAFEDVHKEVGFYPSSTPCTNASGEHTQKLTAPKAAGQSGAAHATPARLPMLPLLAAAAAGLAHALS